MDVLITIIYILISMRNVSTQKRNNSALNKANQNELHVTTSPRSATDNDNTTSHHIETIDALCAIMVNITNCSCNSTMLISQHPQVHSLLCGDGELIGEIDEEIEIAYFPIKRKTQASITTVTMAFGFASNVLVLAVAYKNRKHLPYTKILISQLAIVDVVFSINNFLSEIHLFWSEEWILGLGMCKLISSTYTLSSLLSIGYILVIALERFFGILYSMQRKLSSKHMVYGCVCVNFAFGIAAVIPLLVNASIDEIGVCYDVTEDEHFERTYNWVLITVYIVIPLLIISVIYVRIIRYLIMQAKQNTAINREDIRLKRNKSNQRTMRILLSIMVAFVVCVLPTRLFKLYLAYFRDANTTWSELEAFRWATSITYSLHVCVNPIIYSAVDRESRKDMLEIIGVRAKRCDSTSSTMRFQSTVRGRRVTQFTVIPP